MVYDENFTKTSSSYHFEIYSTLMLPIATILCNSTPELLTLTYLYLITNLSTLTILLSLLYLLFLVSGKHHSTLDFYEINFYRFYMSDNDAILVFWGLACFS